MSTEFSTKSTATHDAKSLVVISPTTYDDLPDLAEAELLAFANTTLSSALAPHRAPSQANGISPRTWPDFHSTARRRARAVASHSFVFTARLKRSDLQTSSGTDLSNPIALMKVAFIPTRKRQNRSWTDLLWGELLYPVLDRLGIGGTVDGLNKEVFEMIHSGIGQARKEIMKDREFAAIDMLFVHPSYQGQGVGSALLKEIISITDAAGLPIFLEASPDAISLYKRYGFVKLRDCNFDYKGKKFSLQLMLREPQTE